MGLIKLPYAPTLVDEGENTNFIMSLLPKNAPQMVTNSVCLFFEQVRATGALLDYLSKRLSQIETLSGARFENILDIQIYQRHAYAHLISFRKQYVYTDSATLIRLQVFDSTTCEPGSRIVNLKRSQDVPELTLFGTLVCQNSSKIYFAY